MRRISRTAAFLTLIAPFVAFATEDASPDPEASLTDIRKEMAAEYRFVPAGTKELAPPSSLTSESLAAPNIAPAVGKDVIRMEPFEVRAGGASTAVLAPLTQTQSEKPSATAAEKLGIGMHYLRLGKVRLFVNTIFYIPVLAGFDW